MEVLIKAAERKVFVTLDSFVQAADELGPASVRKCYRLTVCAEEYASPQCHHLVILFHIYVVGVVPFLLSFFSHRKYAWVMSCYASKRMLKKKIVLKPPGKGGLLMGGVVRLW